MGHALGHTLHNFEEPFVRAMFQIIEMIAGFFSQYSYGLYSYDLYSYGHWNDSPVSLASIVMAYIVMT